MPTDQSQICAQVLNAIQELVNGAVHHERPVRPSASAEELLKQHPDCGMTVAEIEREILRRIGVAQGAIAFGVPSPPSIVPDSDAGNES